MVNMHSLAYCLIIAYNLICCSILLYNVYIYIYIYIYYGHVPKLLGRLQRARPYAHTLCAHPVHTPYARTMCATQALCVSVYMYVYINIYIAPSYYNACPI